MENLENKVTLLLDWNKAELAQQQRYDTEKQEQQFYMRPR
jgi:hypothetical protein